MGLQHWSICSATWQRWSALLRIIIVSKPLDPVNNRRPVVRANVPLIQEREEEHGTHGSDALPRGCSVVTSRHVVRCWWAVGVLYPLPFSDFTDCLVLRVCLPMFPGQAHSLSAGFTTHQKCRVRFRAPILLPQKKHVLTHSLCSSFALPQGTRMNGFGPADPYGTREWGYRSIATCLGCTALAFLPSGVILLPGVRQTSPSTPEPSHCFHLPHSPSQQVRKLGLAVEVEEPLEDLISQGYEPRLMIPLHISNAPTK